MCAHSHKNLFENKMEKTEMTAEHQVRIGSLVLRTSRHRGKGRKKETM